MVSRLAGSIRLRLALWYAGLLALLLVGIGGSVYLVHARAHYRQVDQTLAAVTDHYRSEFEREIAAGAPLDAALASRIDTTGSPLVQADIVVYDATSAVLYGRPVAAATSLVGGADAGDPHGAGAFRTVDTPAGRVRVHTVAVRTAGEIAGYVQATDSLAGLDRSIGRFRDLVVAATALGVLAATAGGVVIASRALRPIADVTETARAIALSKGFGRRLDGTEQGDELGELVRTFNQMLASLEAAYRAQRQFVDDAAHELRAPLTSVLGNIEFLERARDLSAAERAAVTADVRAEVERLARMVAELLTLARADAGLALRRERVEFDRVVVEAVNDARMRAEGVDLRIGDLVPVLVDGDPDRLKQLVIILVDNALRYTPVGGRVRVALTRDADGEGAVLMVADTGIGIAERDLPRIFDRFYRADPARTRVTDGSGLGLAIAQWICEAHGGTIGVESAAGRGSTFTVRLPLAAQ